MAPLLYTHARKAGIALPEETWLQRQYHPPAVYITENGAAFADQVSDGAVHDQKINIPQENRGYDNHDFLVYRDCIGQKILLL